MSEEEKAELEELYENSEWWHNRFNAVQRDNRELKKKYEYVVANYEFEKYKNSKAIEYCDRYLQLDLELFDSYELLKKVKEILGDKENGKE